MPRWRTRVGTLLVVPLLALPAACGSSAAPVKLEPVTPPVPEDLCTLLPDTLTTGLQAASNTDPTGNPTSACSLSSPSSATPSVRAVVTITQYNDESAASDVYDSQCRSLDPAQSTVTAELPVKGAAKACGAQGRQGDVSTLAALRGTEVLTARFSSAPAGKPDALARGTQALEAVIAGSD